MIVQITQKLDCMFFGLIQSRMKKRIQGQINLDASNSYTLSLLFSTLLADLVYLISNDFPSTLQRRHHALSRSL